MEFKGRMTDAAAPSGGQPHYPPLDDLKMMPFRVIAAQFEKFPDLLDRPECPYAHGVKVMLRRLMIADKMGDLKDEVAIDGLTDAASDALDREIASLYLTVKQDGERYTGADMKDKMAFMKTAHDLLSKLVDLQTKRMNIRNMAKMQKAVVEVMEEFLSPAQRTQFITKLKDYIDV